MRYRKRIRLLPGVHLNIGKNGASFNFGAQGLNVTSGDKGTYLNTGIPGSGLSQRTQLSSSSEYVGDGQEEVSLGKGCLNTILGFTVGFPLLLLSIALAITAIIAPVAFLIEAFSNPENVTGMLVMAVLLPIILLLLAWIVFRIFYWSVRSIEHLLGINRDVSSHLPRLFKRKKKLERPKRYSSEFERSARYNRSSDAQSEEESFSVHVEPATRSNVAPQKAAIPDPDLGWDAVAQKYYSRYLGERFVEAAHYLVSVQRCSNSDLQYELNISAGETAKLLKELEKKEIISVAPNGRKTVLLPSERDLMLRLQWLTSQSKSADSIEPGAVDLKNLDPMFAEVARYMVSNQQGSTSVIQRRFELGYNQAGKLVDQLEAAGILGPSKGSKGREVLIQDEMVLRELFIKLGL